MLLYLIGSLGLPILIGLIWMLAVAFKLGLARGKALYWIFTCACASTLLLGGVLFGLALLQMSASMGEPDRRIPIALLLMGNGVLGALVTAFVWMLRPTLTPLKSAPQREDLGE